MIYKMLSIIQKYYYVWFLFTSIFLIGVGFPYANNKECQYDPNNFKSDEFIKKIGLNNYSWENGSDYFSILKVDLSNTEKLIGYFNSCLIYGISIELEIREKKLIKLKEKIKKRIIWLNLNFHPSDLHRNEIQVEIKKIGLNNIVNKLISEGDVIIRPSVTKLTDNSIFIKYQFDGNIHIGKIEKSWYRD